MLAFIFYLIYSLHLHDGSMVCSLTFFSLAKRKKPEITHLWNLDCSAFSSNLEEGGRVFLPFKIYLPNYVLLFPLTINTLYVKLWHAMRATSSAVPTYDNGSMRMDTETALSEGSPSKPLTSEAEFHSTR